MMNLLEDHFAWSYSNPTGYRFFEETFDEDLQETENQHRKEFLNRFDGMLFVHNEMQQQTHLQSLTKRHRHY
jgi:hypothetical protein